MQVHFPDTIGSFMEERYGLQLSSRKPDLIASELKKLLDRWEVTFDYDIHPVKEGWNLEVEEADLIPFYFFIGKLKEESII
jgi:hypothetical protein